MYKWAVTIGIVFGTVCIAAFAFLYKLPMVYKFENESLKSENHKMSSHFVENASYDSEDSAPFLKTGFENRFYSIDENSKISFYESDGKGFKKVKESKSLSITLPDTDGKATVSISFITVDGKTEGYGVYSDKESMTYPYAFLKVIENHITDNFEYIAFADYTIADFYKSKKVYDDAFVVSSDAKKVECLFSRDDYSEEVTLPDEFISERNDGFYFFSRPSNENNTGYKLYLKKTVGGKEKLVGEDISLPVIFDRDGKICILTNTKADDPSERESFKLVELGKENKPIHTFTGNPNEYIVNGKYILNPSAKTVYSVEKNETNTIGSSFTILSVDTFAMNKDGNRMVMVGTFAGNREKLLAYDFSQDDFKVYNGEGLILSGNSNVTFIDDYVYLLAPAETSSKVRNYIIDWASII